MRLTILTLIAISLYCTGCYQSYYISNDLPTERLEFGIGESDTYIEHYALLKSGQLLKQAVNQDTFFQVRILDRATVKSIFYQRDSIRLLSYDHYLPGTNYRFINQIDPQTEHNIAWADGDERTPEAISYFYELLLNSTKEEPKEELGKSKNEKVGKTESFGW